MIRFLLRLLGLRALMLWLAKRERARLAQIHVEAEQARRAEADRIALRQAYINAPTHREARRIMEQLWIEELRG